MMIRPEDPRQRYWRQVRDLADEHEVSSSEARTLWRRFYQKGGIRRLLLALTPNRTVPTICPYCRDELPVFHNHEDACYQCGTFLHPEPDGFECAPEAKWTCPRCSTMMHLECYQELTKCTTLGCTGRANRRHRAIDVGVRPRVYEPELTPANWPFIAASTVVLIMLVLAILAWAVLPLLGF